MESLFAVGVESGAMIVAEQNRALIEGRVDRLVHMHGGQIIRVEIDGPGRTHGGRGVTDVIVTTLNLAAIYGLVAVGISITWAGLGFLNLAQGTTFAIAGYGAWWASVHISSSSPVVILAGIVTALRAA